MTSEPYDFLLDKLVGMVLVFSTGHGHLMAAFNRVIELSARRQFTDLHVRRLLNYIRAQDKRDWGAERSVKQLANMLILSISTCRRVICRASADFSAMANRTPPEQLAPSILDFSNFDLSKIDFAGVNLSTRDFAPARISGEMSPGSAVQTNNDDAPATTDQPP